MEWNRGISQNAQHTEMMKKIERIVSATRFSSFTSFTTGAARVDRPSSPAAISLLGATSPLTVNCTAPNLPFMQLFKNSCQYFRSIIKPLMLQYLYL
jgi:hypothetical protein